MKRFGVKPKDGVLIQLLLMFAILRHNVGLTYGMILTIWNHTIHHTTTIPSSLSRIRIRMLRIWTIVLFDLIGTAGIEQIHSSHSFSHLFCLRWVYTGSRLDAIEAILWWSWCWRIVQLSICSLHTEEENKGSNKHNPCGLLRVHSARHFASYLFEEEGYWWVDWWGIMRSPSYCHCDQRLPVSDTVETLDFYIGNGGSHNRGFSGDATSHLFQVLPPALCGRMHALRNHGAVGNHKQFVWVGCFRG